jgi:hypothetical protein
MAFPTKVHIEKYTLGFAVRQTYASGTPSRMAPDFPKNRYLTACRLKTLPSSCALLNSNVAIGWN